ncbi:MAG: hypothetical protein K9K39_09495 [Desulfohalobiaceae bacterium]|nr:hypothetical protein [Desulfohalobiaceae bacterium]
MMWKCGLCGGEAPRQPKIDEEGPCELCNRVIVLREQSRSAAGWTGGYLCPFASFDFSI